MKPSKEQIEAWVGQVLPGAPVVLPDDAKIAELAYAAGRKAGMEEAARIIRARIMGDFNREDQEAERCANAIRTAMEANK